MKNNATTAKSDDRRIFLISFIVLAVAGTAITLFPSKPVYEAKLFFRIIKNPEWLEMAKETSDQQDPSSVLSLIQSDIITNRVSTEPKIAKSAEIGNANDPVKKLKSMVAVKSEGGGEIFAIVAHSTDRETAALVAQTFWEQFDLEQDKFKIGALNDRIATDKIKLKTMQADLQESYTKLANSASSFLIDNEGLILNQKVDEDIAVEQEKIQNYNALRLEFEQKEKDYLSTCDELMKLRMKVRQTQQKKIAPFSVIRVFVENENEAVPVPIEPIKNYRLEQIREFIRSILY